MADIALLDGGLGQEINKRWTGDTHPLWSVKVMFEEPSVVEDVYIDFINAGARVICLNTYTATPTRMTRHDMGDRFEEAHATAAKIATNALEKTNTLGLVQIAGCVSPLVASYVAEVSQNYESSLQEFRKVVEQQRDKVDLFLIETMSNIEEATAALDAVKETSKPVYVGLTLSDDLSDTLRSREPLQDAINALVPRKPDGIMLNCSIPEAITQAMPILAKSGLKFGAYANGFTSIDKLRPGGTVDVLKARQDLTPDAYAAYVEKWVDHGATIVGGCCEVGPEHIKQVYQRLNDLGHTVTKLN